MPLGYPLSKLDEPFSFDHLDSFVRIGVADVIPLLIHGIAPALLDVSGNRMAFDLAQILVGGSSCFNRFPNLVHWPPSF